MFAKIHKKNVFNLFQNPSCFWVRCSNVNFQLQHMYKEITNDKEKLQKNLLNIKKNEFFIKRQLKNGATRSFY